MKISSLNVSSTSNTAISMFMLSFLECFIHFKHGNFHVHAFISILHFDFAHTGSFRVLNKDSHKIFILLSKQNLILLLSTSTRITPPSLTLPVWLRGFFSTIFVVNDFLTTAHMFLQILIHYNFGNSSFTYIFDFKDLGVCFLHSLV